MAAGKSKPSFQEINQAAAGRWREIIAAVAHCSADLLTTKGKPCPKCGGTDRFAAFDDFARSGGVSCRHCHNASTKPKCGNGIHTVAWLNDLPVCDAAKLIADYLGLSGETPAPKDIIALVCADKRMPVDAFKRFEPKPAKRGLMDVARVPVYNELGKPFSHFDLAPGRKGWFKKGKGSAGLFFPGRLPAAGEPWLIVEGVKDAAALVGLGFNAVGVPGNSMHAKYADLFSGCDIIIVPDLDEPSFDGANKTGGGLWQIATSIKVARLPGVVVQSKGNDVRDILSKPDGQSMVRAAIESAVEWVPIQTAAKPMVFVTFDESTVAEQVIASLNRDPERQIYQRSGQLVHLTAEVNAAGGVETAAQFMRIRMLPASLLRERIASAVELVVETEEEDKPSRPPCWLVNAIHQRGSYPVDQIPPLNGIVRCPTMRPDGSVIQQPGYDNRTGLLFAPDGEYPPISDAPTFDEAQQAAAELLDVVCDFPFADDSHRSAWLALVLTLVARPAIDDCCPLFAIDANTRGSGKSKLADLAGMIVYGNRMPRKAMSRDDEETRKTITSIAIEALPAVLFDNVTGTLGCPSLDAALTANEWHDRILGKSETTGTLALSTVWIATGNNLSFVADTARRTLFCRLESPLENPEDRSDFKQSDVVRFAKQNRQRLATAAVTIVRGYVNAGCPDVDLRTWGSYESWSSLIRGTVVWCGLPDPFDTHLDVRQSDQSSETLLMLLDALADVGPVTAAEIVKLLSLPVLDDDDPYDGLRAAVDEFCPPKQSGGRTVYSARSLGNHLKKYVGRVCGGSRLVRGEKTKTGYAWLVEQLDRPADAPVQNDLKPNRQWRPTDATDAPIARNTEKTGENRGASANTDSVAVGHHADSNGLASASGASGAAVFRQSKIEFDPSWGTV